MTTRQESDGAVSESTLPGVSVLWWYFMNPDDSSLMGTYANESWPSIENNSTHFSTVGLFISFLILFCLVFDDKDGNAAWQRRHRRQTRGEASPVSAVSQVLLQQPPAGAAHQVIIWKFRENSREKMLMLGAFQSSHGWEAVQMFVLWSEIQTTVSRPAAHPSPHR